MNDYEVISKQLIKLFTEVSRLCSTKSCLPLFFKFNFIKTHNDAHTVMYCLWLFSCFNFRVEQVVIKTMWPTKSKILSGFLQKIFVHLDID